MLDIEQDIVFYCDNTNAGKKGNVIMTPSKKPFDVKSATLRKHGSLNPRPEKVSDNVFADSDFFDPRDLMQVKYEMLRRVEKDGWPVARSAAAFGLSRVAFYRTQKSFKKAGIPGLLRHRPGPQHPHKLSENIMQFLRETLQKKPLLSPKELSLMINEHFGVSVHHRSIERALKRPQKKGFRGIRRKNKL